MNESLIVCPEQRVEPAWIDYNGHMNMAYYNLAFDRALDHVARDARLLRLLDRRVEPRVGVDVAAPELRCDRDFLHQLLHDLALLQVNDRAFGVEPLTSHEGKVDAPARPPQRRSSRGRPAVVPDYCAWRAVRRTDGLCPAGSASRSYSSLPVMLTSTKSPTGAVMGR